MAAVPTRPGLIMDIVQETETIPTRQGTFGFDKGNHSFISTDYCYLSSIAGEMDDGVPNGKRICCNCANLIDLKDLDSINSDCKPRMSGSWYVPYLPLFK